MTVLYSLPLLPPKLPQAEALFQEITALRAYFGGELLYLNPNQHSPIYIPRLLFGFHRLRTLWAKEQHIDLHHFYNPDPFPFPFLRALRRPIIYTISSGIGRRRPNMGYFAKLAAVAVPDARSLKQLQAWGLSNGVWLKPGIDTRRFSYQPCPLADETHLLMASAPWTMAQFRSKGVEALLEAAQQDRRLRLTFLWRGVLYEAMRQRVDQLGLTERVRVINQQVELDPILAQVHATIVLADAPGIIKSYPHSLLDSLAAGKPVLLNHVIPMADYVTETACGVVMPDLSAAAILQAVAELRHDYQHLVEAARECGQRDFDLRHPITAHERLYQQLLQNGRVDG